MQQFGGKDSKRHFTVVRGNEEGGLYISSTPSSAAKKAATKLCASNNGKKVEFHIREITQGSKKKTYGPYLGYIEKLKEPIELKGRVIKYKPVANESWDNNQFFWIFFMGLLLLGKGKNDGLYSITPTEKKNETKNYKNDSIR